MSTLYAQSLELLTRVQEHVDIINLDSIKSRITVQKWYALSQDWYLLRDAVIAMSEAEEKAAVALQQHRDLFYLYANEYNQTGRIRVWLADACLKFFRYVTELSHHARLVRRDHESDMLSSENFRDHYEDALGPQAHTIRSHQTFLDVIAINLRIKKRNQALEMVYVRWVHLRAAADLRRYARDFHSTRRRLEVWRRRGNRASVRLIHLNRVVDRGTKEFTHLKRETVKVQRAIQALSNVMSRPDRRTVGASTSVQDANADQRGEDV